MRIIFIAAMSENRVIGKRGKLPWSLPKDLLHFKKLTLKQAVLMGRKTFASLKSPLKNRQNLVLTTDRFFSHPDVVVFHSKEEVLNSCFNEIFVIGGEEIFRLFLADCEKIYLTIVHADLDGDAYFPEFSGFKETSRQLMDADERHDYSFSFITYEKMD